MEAEGILFSEMKQFTAWKRMQIEKIRIVDFFQKETDAHHKI